MTDIGAVILEILFTAAFLATILASTKRAPALAPLAIPLTLVAIHFAAATLSGASVNPARSIGSALVGGDLSAIWIYLVGPLVGAVAGWGIWRLVDGGAQVRAAATPWVLGPGDQDLVRRWLDERVEAVLDERASVGEEVRDWWSRRQAQLEAGVLRVEVDHVDLLVLPAEAAAVSSPAAPTGRRR